MSPVEIATYRAKISIAFNTLVHRAQAEYPEAEGAGIFAEEISNLVALMLSQAGTEARVRMRLLLDAADKGGIEVMKMIHPKEAP